MTILRLLLLAGILLAALGGPLPASAQSTTTTRFDTLSVEDGLSQGTVRVIFQDAQGFMWFGTDDGLNKYDGYTFTLYKHDVDNPDSLADNSITAIFQDASGSMWFGTTGGVDRFIRDSETFQHFRPRESGAFNLRGAEVSAIIKDRQGTIWVSTRDGGLNRFDAEKNTFIAYPHAAKNPDTPTSDQINVLLAEQKRGIWIGTNHGLDYLDTQTGRYTHFKHNINDPTSLADDEILSLYQDRVGTLWVGMAGGGLDRFNAGGATFSHYRNNPDNPYTLSSNQIHAISEDKSGHLWVGGHSGLNQLNRGDEYFTRFQHDPNDSHSLSSDTVLSLYTDRTGVLWIGTYGGGISKYVQNNERFALYQHRPGVSTSLSNDMVYAITEDRDGSVWVGTMDGGLNRLDPEAGTFYAYQAKMVDPNGLNNNDVRAIYEDHRGILWVGTNGGGLNRFDRDLNLFTHFLHDDRFPDTIADNRITAIIEDRRGNLWIGTRGGGLDLMDESTGRFIHFRHNSADPASLSDDYVRVIYEDRSGSLWVGTNNGLSLMDPNTRRFQNFYNDPRNPFSLSDNRVLSILETGDGILWFGTLLGGLERYDPNTESFKHYTQKQGLPSNAVYGVLADRNGFLWLSTNRGISRFDSQSETFRNYDRSDGLQSYEFNPGAAFENSRGRIYFGGVQGFNAFDPANVEDNALPPQVVVTAFKKFNQTNLKDLTGGEKINLSFQDNFISFEFAALDYSAPEKNQYAYKLEGFDKDWIYAGSRRYASYTNLRGGNYTFHVIGSNQDGIWNEVGASIEIVVTPPIYENWWFISSAVFLLLGATFLGYRLRIKSIQTRNLNLENQVIERTREIERRRQVAEGLREILDILNSNRSLRESLDAIILQVMRLMRASAVFIFRCDESGEPVILASNLFADPERNRPPSLPGWLTRPVLEGKSLLLPDVTHRLKENPDLDAMSFWHYSTLLAVPLVVNDRTDGGLVILYHAARKLSEDDLQVAANFANHAALSIANAQLRNQAEENAVTAERNRLARDLHDAVTQTLFATSLIAEVLPRLWDRSPEAGKQKITEIRELTRGALAEMRTLLMELRPSALIDVPLPDLLQQLCDAFAGRARVPVRLDIQKPVDLPANVKIGFYRIAQEALNNIQKHSHATQVEVALQMNREQVVLSIQDNGVGFDPGSVPPNHLGLGIMDERAHVIGAVLDLETHADQGTRVTVTWRNDGIDAVPFDVLRHT